MQPLRDYLNESPLQYEGILDPDQNKVMDRMTDEMIRRRIQEYCTYDRQKDKLGKLWCVASYNLKITKVDKDNKGWYIETNGFTHAWTLYGAGVKSFYDYCLLNGQKIDEKKGFLIEDAGVYFRWRRHSGIFQFYSSPKLESTDGLPEELNELYLSETCADSKKFEVRNKIKVMLLSDVGDIKISGNGCENILVDPERPYGEITAPNGVKIHYPDTRHEYWDLRNKLRILRFKKN